MANESEESRADISEQEEEGGPVKSFLEHLEDLRWMLIKSISALGVAVVICLFGGNLVVSVLTRPLRQATINYPKKDQVVSVFFGTNRLGIYTVTPDKQESLGLPTNRFVNVYAEPVLVGTNRLLGLRAEPDPTRAAEKLNVPLVNLSPAGGFIVAFQVAIYAGILVASPFILYFVAMFVFPALKMKEKKYAYRGMGFGLGLFLVGVSFCYFALLPVALRASMQYSEWLGFAVMQWRAEDYIGFVSKFMLGMGIGFELPVPILVLVKLGVLSYSTLAKARRYVIVINFTLGAILTTPEVITQVLMAVPLQILYEITVWIAWDWERQEKKRVEAEDLAEAAGLPLQRSERE